LQQIDSMRAETQYINHTLNTSKSRNITRFGKAPRFQSKPQTFAIYYLDPPTSIITFLREEVVVPAVLALAIGQI